MDADSVGKLRLGTAPDSWGVWFPEHPRQVPWTRFLDEAARAGYKWIELGPYGYLPTNPEQLQDELGRRGLQLSGGTASGGLQRGASSLVQAQEDCRNVAELIVAVGARHVVFLPEMYRDLDGRDVYARDLSRDEWNALVSGVSMLGKILFEEHGIRLEFHPHADSHVDDQRKVERFLADTDPESVSLCLDTGHIAYCGGDNMELIEKCASRIGYVHLKAVDQAVVDEVHMRDLCFAEAVGLGAMVEPPGGVPSMKPLLDRLEALDLEVFTIVEQDLFPCDGDTPFPIATRTHRYLTSCGIAWRSV